MKHFLKACGDFAKAMKINFVNLFAFFVVGSIIFYFFWVTKAEIPKDNMNIVTEAKSTFSVILAAVISYFFGSSKSSASKDEVIKNSLKRQKDAEEDNSDGGRNETIGFKSEKRNT